MKTIFEITQTSKYLCVIIEAAGNKDRMNDKILKVIYLIKKNTNVLRYSKLLAKASKNSQILRENS